MKRRIVYRLKGMEPHTSNVSLTNLKNGSCYVIDVESKSPDVVFDFRIENFVYVDKKVVGEIMDYHWYNIGN